MSRVHYVGANGEEPPLTELEQEKLKGQQLANEIAQTKLRQVHEEVLERREVKFVFRNDDYRLAPGVHARIGAGG